MHDDNSQKKSYSKEAYEFDQSFIKNPCRKAYDILGWQAASALSLPEKAVIIDAGCGTGRWCKRYLNLGHNVIGIENAPGMISCLKEKNLGANFTLISENMEKAKVPIYTADLIIAIGSLQYCHNQEDMIARFFKWLKPGGKIIIMVDSILSLVSEFLQNRAFEKAEKILQTREGSFTAGGITTRLHLYDSQSLKRAFFQAGFGNISCRGLVVQGASLGRERCAEAMKNDSAAFLKRDKILADHEVMADCGLHLFLTAQRNLR